MIRITEACGFNERGVRENNEDAIRADSNQANGQSRFYIVCDGVGGHGHGEVASRIVAEGFQSALQVCSAEDEISPQQLQQFLDDAIEQLNAAYTPDSEKKMGTTLVVAVFNQNHMLVGHVGDSRCYLFRNGEIVFRTTDHSAVEEGVAAGFITEEQARNHPKKNVITRCVQPFPDKPVRIDVDIVDGVKTGDILLLCTDGVTDALDNNCLSGICMLNISTPEKMETIKATCAEHSRDNYSGYLLALEQDEMLSDVQEDPAREVEGPELEERICCDDCGNEINKAFKFCPVCGADSRNGSRRKSPELTSSEQKFSKDYFGHGENHERDLDRCLNCPVGKFLDRVSQNRHVKSFFDLLSR